MLTHATEEADRLASQPISPAHLLLGLLHEKRSLASSILHDFGLNLSDLRLAVAKLPPEEESTNRIELHGRHYPWHLIEAAAKAAEPFLWNETRFVVQDIVVRRTDRKRSFDLHLAGNSTDFELIKGGWEQTACRICGWELRECDDPERGMGYTNGRDWICSECFNKVLIKPFHLALTSIRPGTSSL